MVDNIAMEPYYRRSSISAGCQCQRMFLIGQSDDANQQAAMATIAEKVSNNTKTVLEMSKVDYIQPREAAIQMAGERVKKVMSMRRWSLFSSSPHFFD